MDRKLVSSPVLWKLSDLLVNESVPFLGLEDQFESIESKLRDIVNSEFFDCKRDVAYDIEEAIDFLLEKAAQRSQRGNLMNHVLSFVDSMDEKKLRKKLDRISLEILRAADKLGRRRGPMDAWSSSASNSTRKKPLDVGESIISPVVRKVIALASQEQINPSVRRLARWVRDEMRLLHVYVKDLESKELRGEEMAWMEEVTLFSRSAEDVIGYFLTGTEQSSRSKNGGLKNLGFSPFKFNSQRKLKKEMDLMKIKVQEMIKRYGKLPYQMSIPPARFPPNLPPPPIPFQPNFPGRYVPNIPGDATSLSSYDDDDDFDDEFDETDDGTMPFPGPDDQTQQSDMSNAGASSSSSSRRAEYPDVNGFDSNFDDIKELLTRGDPNCLTVSVLGMEGIGKSKLVRSIYECPAIRDHFPHRAWVNWVRDSNINRFMEQIMGAQYLNTRHMNGDWDDYLCRLRRLLNDFLMDRRYLIVIDGVSSKVLWNQLGAAFDGLSNGSRVIFISSKVGVTPEAGPRNFTYRLQLWSDEESWSLFVRSLNVNIPLELLQLKKKDILRVCGGLPKAIVKLAELLARENIFAEDWARVIDKFNNDEGSWSGTLQEINKNLPLHLRRCLFYFQFFPQHFEIPARRLIGLWAAEDLGQQKNVRDSPEQVPLKCLIELVNRNTIQVTEKKLNGKLKTCRLPDPLRVHWLVKAKEANFLNDNGHIGDNLGTSSSSVRRLVDHLDPRDSSFDHIHGENLNANASCVYSCYRETVSFLSFDTREGSRPGEDVGNFFERCITSKCFSSLWVLDLEHVYKPKLPKAVSQLTRLKYFGLRSTHLEMLPSFINKLLKLQTLDLKHTRVDALPSSIWMMQELRHLFLDESSCCVFAPPPPKGGCLRDIQTLWGAFVTEDSPVRDGFETFLNLRKLGLTCKISDPAQNEAMSSQLDAVASWIVKLTHLQSLKLKSFNESGRPSDIVLESLSGHMNLSSIHLVGNLKNQHLLSELPENLIELTLSESGLGEDPMQMLDKLPNLRVLRLVSGTITGAKIVSSSGGFPKLQVLKLWELEALEQWSIEEGAMASLKSLEIKSCRNLETLPEGLIHLKNLHKLKLKDMAVLSARINDNQGEDWDKVAHVLHLYTEN